MLKFSYPLKVIPGDEIVCPAIKTEPLKETIRVTFHWGDPLIQVMGAKMIAPNVFEFGPDKNARCWYLKYTVAQTTLPAKKTVYLTVDIVKTNAALVWTARILATLLFVAPLVLYISRSVGHDLINQFFEFQIVVGTFFVGIPLGLILFVFLWTTKVTQFITRLFSVKVQSRVDYGAKGFALVSCQACNVV